MWKVLNQVRGVASNMLTINKIQKNKLLKKGFTLVELLAVLTILAILALITVPVVTGILNNSRKESKKLSAEFYIDAVNKSILAFNITYVGPEDGTYPIMLDGNLCLGQLSNDICSADILNVDTDGQRPKSGNITLQNQKVVEVSNVEFEKFYANMNYGENITISKDIVQ